MGSSNGGMVRPPSSGKAGMLVPIPVGDSLDESSSYHADEQLKLLLGQADWCASSLKCRQNFLIALHLPPEVDGTNHPRADPPFLQSPLLPGCPHRQLLRPAPPSSCSSSFH